jgi:NitT/TauT family transport system substrate-binding protein
LVQTSHAADSKVTIRAGHFPNVTHAQGVIGQARGDFEKALGDKADIDWKLFNSGTSAIEALFAGELDITYIGPNPAVNGYIKSDGEALRIVSRKRGSPGCMKDAGIASAKTLTKKFATPSRQHPDVA